MPTICFDLDGTLLDSHEGLTRSYAHALVAMGHAAPALEDLKACIGPPLRENFARLLGTRDPVLVEGAVAAFRERYGDVGWSEGSLYEGVLPMLEATRAMGVRVVIATAKPQKFTDRIVAHFGLDRYVDEAFGPTLDGSLDDKRRLMAHVIARTGLSPARSALVGDRHTDIIAALAHGLLPVGITWGYGSREELAEAGADVICASPPEVVSHLLAWRP